jgi:hypothetical protein
MVYCGSGSYFGKVLVPVPVLGPVLLKQNVVVTAVPVPALFHNIA